MSVATEVYQEILSSAESIDKSQLQRFSDASCDGDMFRQGDVYVVRRENMLDRTKPTKNPSPQVAPGTTRGSRHILDSLQGVKMFQVENPTPLNGPVIEVSEERVLTHPEHGDVALPPGCYQIFYQRAFADELRAVRD